ncbi:DUF7659 family protein [Ekhidna sp.]
MKYLSDYMNDKQSKLFKQTGAFFAFSQNQFDEQKKEGIKYTSIPGGMICPKENVETLLNGLTKIHKEGIEQDIAENGIDKIIIRELYNYECFYTRDYSDVISHLKSYDITEEQIKKAFYKEAPNAE